MVAATVRCGHEAPAINRSRRIGLVAGRVGVRRRGRGVAARLGLVIGCDSSRAVRALRRRVRASRTSYACIWWERAITAQKTLSRVSLPRAQGYRAG